MVLDFLSSFSLSLGKLFGSDDKNEDSQQRQQPTQNRPLSGISLVPVRSVRSSKSFRSSRSWKFRHPRGSGSRASSFSESSGDQQRIESPENPYELRVNDADSHHRLTRASTVSVSPKSEAASSAHNSAYNSHNHSKASSIIEMSANQQHQQQQKQHQKHALNDHQNNNSNNDHKDLKDLKNKLTGNDRKGRFSSSGDILDRYGGFVLDPLSYMILQAAKQMHGATAATSATSALTNMRASSSANNLSGLANINTTTNTSTGLSRRPSAAPTVVITSSLDSPGGTGSSSGNNHGSGSRPRSASGGLGASTNEQHTVTSLTNTSTTESIGSNRLSKPTITLGRSSTRSSNSRGIFGGLFKSSGRPTLHDETSSQLPGESREEGWNADVVGFVPDAPVKLKYVRVRSHKKYHKDFNRLFLAQELVVKGDESWHNRVASRASIFSSVAGDHPALSPSNSGLVSLSDKDPTSDNSKSAVWCATFSSDGRYLAVAGEDCIIRVWQVISSPKDRESGVFTDDADDASSVRGRKRAKSRKRNLPYAPVFIETPVREFVGHTSDVLDLSWSKNNFLLSSSMDKTVKLWHVDRPYCLGSFLHADFVTSIKFHPQDDRFFLSGSLDCRLRLWSIPDKEVAFMKMAPDLITAVAFSPSGDVAIAGCFGGQCLFFETNNLKLISQIRVRSSRGRNSKGSRITGIEPITSKDNTYDDRSVKVLISTNDSRIRIYNLYDRSLDTKLKGHENEQGQIKASFSDNGQFVISGSEDERTYIWRLPSTGSGGTKERQDYEYFHFNKAPVTCAIFAPTLTRRILSASKDPVYDLCNPPPVKLTPPDEYPNSMKMEESSEEFPALPPDTAKTRHEDGNIIVTTDRKGLIKVFRQDCAFENRRAFPELVSFMQKKRLSYMGLSPQHSHRTIGGGSIRGLRSNGSPSLRATSPRSSSGFFDSSRLRDTLSLNTSRSSLNVASEDNIRRHSPPENTENNSNMLCCTKCASTEFKASKIDNKIVLICSACNTPLKG